MKLAFIHIPKCGGTAFENYLLNSLARRQLRARCFTGLSASGNPESLPDYIQVNEDSPFLFGHVTLSDYRTVIADPFFLTMLRDPVERTISNYKSWHDPKNFTPEHADYQVGSSAAHEALSFAQRATLEEFVSCDLPYVQKTALGNLQTLYLCTDRGAGDSQRLDSAKRNLASLGFFGLLEEFARSIDYLRQIFPELPAYELSASRENRSRVQVEVPSKRTIEMIREQTQLDHELYAYALTLFEDRLASEPPLQYEIGALLKPLASAALTGLVSETDVFEAPSVAGTRLRSWLQRLLGR